MKQATKKRQQGQTLNRFAFKLSPVAAGCAVLMIGMSDIASAQEAPTNTVVVTGIRRGIEDAISVKKNADSIVESISAEDIGKLPDTSIAESLARLPGLSAQRVNGQAQQISIRGTSGDLSTVTLNGREQVSTSASRIVEYDQYPSELISAATVYKTGDASLVGQGLSGTVDLQTVSPLAFGGRTIALNARGEKNSLGSESAGSPSTGNRFSVSYIDQFANRTLGVALGFAHSDKPNVNNFFETWNWVDGVKGVPAGVKAPQGVKAIVYTGNSKRDGLIGVVEWKPSKSFTSTFDAYHSKLEQNEIRRGVEIPFESWSGATFSNLTVLNGLAVAGDINASPVIRNNSLTKDSEITAFGWKNKFTANNWTAVADFSHSSANIHEKLIEINSGRGAQNIRYNYNNGQSIPTFTFADSLSDPAAIAIGGKFGDGYVNAPALTDKLNSIRFSLKRDFSDGFITSAEVGVNYSKRDKTKEHLETGFSKIGAGTFSPAVLNAPQDLSSVGFPSSLSWDIPAVLSANFGPYTPVVLNPWGATKNWSLTEKVTTGYGKLNLETTAFSIPVTGNVGVQMVHTDQSSTSNALLSWPIAALVPITDGKAYDDVLPSLNLAANFSGEQVVRLGLGRSIARAKLDELNAAREVGLSNGKTGTPSGNGGNAQLDPWRADYIDLSYEKYFGKKAYVSAAVFYKDLKSYIYKQTTPYDFSSMNIAGATTNIGTFTQPVNGQGGKLEGLELAVSLPFELITPALDGFGLTANLSLTNSAISIKNSRFGDQSVPLPGLSRNVRNITVYYEKYGYSARLSERYRSDFVGEIGGPGGQNELTFVKADNVFDLQLGYDFSTGFAKGASLLFQVNNLTDTAFQTYSGTPDRPRGYQKYGRQILFGVNYKM
ncbi:MAG: TonB-dependent receptor [Burkholderiales bacterium]|nr:TonB-dependent receptor [Burkholderiales bacterium]